VWERIRHIWRTVCGAHRSDDATERGSFVEFFLPRLTRGFFIRMGVVAAVAAVLFGFVLIPCYINGESMMPTFPSRGFTLNWRGKYLFSKPERGDVVIIRYSDKVYYLKRVVGLPGDTVAFHRGDLYVNGRRVNEPYVKYLCDWELPPRKVRPGHYYVVGDNRSQHITDHKFGQVLEKRIDGAPLW
jgi:signal peptidase I